ncbi:MAG: LysM peptidoglycan-binding domain-containing protein [Anaerolineales bacterium]|nr:MAG: LysM peptidoglycan-binding domain-containing protein [Anaerolineales bacterium]
MEDQHKEELIENQNDQERETLFTRIRNLLGDLLAGENGRRILTIGGVILLVITVIFAIRAFYPEARGVQASLPLFSEQSGEEDSGNNQADQQGILEMPSFVEDQAVLSKGIHRAAVIHTTIPTRSRVDVLTYIVEQGDSLFAIAETFGLKPETVLWGNFDTLADNPHTLQPGQELNILPVNGTYHEWRDGENLPKVASYYGVDPLEIIQYPGNKIDIYDFDLDNPSFEIGQMLIIPGGERELVDYGPPAITRDNPAIAATYGPGHCGTIYTGNVGVGVFIWPTTERWVVGYDYNPGANHPAIDIAGSIENPVWASDNGVVVYAGWSNYGYGNLIVVDHGTGWQTLYAHLNSTSVGCGQSVNQGQRIGGLGSTGNSSGAHLHFEMIYVGTKVNPWNFLQ